jgi:nicotinamidase-related amidase
MNTDRLSGLSGGPLKPMTPLRLYIQENDITTVFFGGVNTDQCVVST